MGVIIIIRKVSFIIGIIGLIASALTIYQFIDPFLPITLSWNDAYFLLIAISVIISILLFSYGLYNLFRKIMVSRDLKHQINQIDDLKQRRNERASVEKWVSTTESIIRNFWGEDSKNHKDFLNIRYHPTIPGMYEADRQRIFVDALEEAKGFLQARLNELKQKF